MSSGLMEDKNEPFLNGLVINGFCNVLSCLVALFSCEQNCARDQCYYFSLKLLIINGGLNLLLKP